MFVVRTIKKLGFSRLFQNPGFLTKPGFSPLLHRMVACIPHLPNFNLLPLLSDFDFCTPHRQRESPAS